MIVERQNPFTVTSPEDLPADHVISLFVDVFTDFPRVRDSGHCFLHGPRGSGKSMIFRYLQPDCQLKEPARQLSDLDFYAIYVPVKNSQLNIMEFQRLEQVQGSVALNEHFMTMCFAERIFNSLVEYCSGVGRQHLTAIAEFVNESVIDRLKACGMGDPPAIGRHGNSGDYFLHVQRLFQRLFTDVLQYLKRIPFAGEPVPFTGPLCGYLDFLLPILHDIKNLPFLPDKPIYLLVDDADNLSYVQTLLLNTWVSTRTHWDVSLKISTQFQYKHYRTITGQTIDTPHDFSEVNISTVYTSKRGTYRGRIRTIVEKRLRLHGFDPDPDKFFPPDEQQEAEIEAIADKYRKDWKKRGRGNRPSDDAVRYARPDFIKSLGGTSKSQHTYSYAGFEQLVHVSSGIVRQFLEAAADMYGEAQSRQGTVAFIPPGIQSDVLRTRADHMLFYQIQRREGGDLQTFLGKEKVSARLFSLLQALGGTFARILESDRSERRVFSIAFSNEPDEEVCEVLKRGIIDGYFQESTIGRKDGMGRTQLYILNRMLAPAYNLDPTGFSGYLFVTNEKVRAAMDNPDRFLREIKEHGVDTVGEEQQLALFD